MTRWRVYYTTGGPPYLPRLTRPSSKLVAEIRARWLKLRYTDAVQALPVEQAEARYEERSKVISDCVTRLDGDPLLVKLGLASMRLAAEPGPLVRRTFRSTSLLPSVNLDQDPPLCGDPTCEGPGCRQSAVDAYLDRKQREDTEAIHAYLTGRTDDLPGWPD